MRQFQIPLLSSSADAAWIIRFDDVIADELELGPLRQGTVDLPNDLLAKIEAMRPEKLPTEVIQTLITPTMPPTDRRTANGWCCP